MSGVTKVSADHLHSTARTRTWTCRLSLYGTLTLYGVKDGVEANALTHCDFETSPWWTRCVVCWERNTFWHFLSLQCSKDTHGNTMEQSAHSEAKWDCCVCVCVRWVHNKMFTKLWTADSGLLSLQADDWAHVGCLAPSSVKMLA